MNAPRAALGRRGLLLAAGGLSLVAGAAQAAWARDVGIYTEPTLGPAIRAVARRFTAKQGPGVSVLAASAPLLLAQIKHNAAHDLLIVPASYMDQAETLAYVRPATRHALGRTDLVIAAATGSLAGWPKDPAMLLGEGTIAITDPTPADTLDGAAVLAALGLTAAKTTGVATTLDAAAMVLAGTARFALVYQADVLATPGLMVAATLEKAPAKMVAVAMNPDPPSLNAQALLDFLATNEAQGLLRAGGVEV